MPNRIEFEPNSRVFICGATGTGKSFFAVKLLAGHKRLIVLDSKNNLQNKMKLQPESKSAWQKFRRGKPIRMHIRAPVLSADQYVAYYEPIFQKIYAVGDCIVYIDELGMVTNGVFTMPTYLNALYKLGREPIKDRRSNIIGGNIGIVASTQRPSGIPISSMSESGYYIVFRMNNPEDRIKVAAYSAPEVREQIPDEHGFYYYKNGMDKPEYYASLP